MDFAGPRHFSGGRVIDGEATSFLASVSRLCTLCFCVDLAIMVALAATGQRGLGAQ